MTDEEIRKYTGQYFVRKHERKEILRGLREDTGGWVCIEQTYNEKMRKQGLSPVPRAPPGLEMRAPPGLEMGPKPNDGNTQFLDEPNAKKGGMDEVAITDEMKVEDTVVRASLEMDGVAIPRLGKAKVRAQTTRGRPSQKDPESLRADLAQQARETREQRLQTIFTHRVGQKKEQDEQHKRQEHGRRRMSAPRSGSTYHPHGLNVQCISHWREAYEPLSVELMEQKSTHPDRQLRLELVQRLRLMWAEANAAYLLDYWGQWVDPKMNAFPKDDSKIQQASLVVLTAERQEYRFGHCIEQLQRVLKGSPVPLISPTIPDNCIITATSGFDAFGYARMQNGDCRQWRIRKEPVEGVDGRDAESHQMRGSVAKFQRAFGKLQLEANVGALRVQNVATSLRTQDFINIRFPRRRVLSEDTEELFAHMCSGEFAAACWALSDIALLGGGQTKKFSPASSLAEAAAQSSNQWAVYIHTLNYLKATAVSTRRLGDGTDKKDASTIEGITENGTGVCVFIKHPKEPYYSHTGTNAKYFPKFMKRMEQESTDVIRNMQFVVGGNWDNERQYFLSVLNASVTGMLVPCNLASGVIAALEKMYKELRGPHIIPGNPPWRDLASGEPVPYRRHWDKMFKLGYATRLPYRYGGFDADAVAT